MKTLIRRFTPVAAALALCCALLMPRCAAAADNAYRDKIDKFFSMMKDGKAQEAIDFIYSDNPWMAKNADAIFNVKNQLANMVPMIGAYRAHELVVEKVVAGRYAYLYYFVAYDRQPLSFVFEYYKPQDQWMLFGFSFNAGVDEAVAEQAKKDMFSAPKS